MWIYQFDFKPDYVGKPVWNTRSCLYCLHVCVDVFEILVEQLCLDGILTMTFNAEGGQWAAR